MLNLRYGPDGQVYIIDWYDTNACHHTNAEGHDRTNGRILQGELREGRATSRSICKKLSDANLAELVLEQERLVRAALAANSAGASRGRQARPRLLAIDSAKLRSTTRRRNTPAAGDVGAARDGRLPDEVVPTAACRSERIRARLDRATCARSRSAAIGETCCRSSPRWRRAISRRWCGCILRRRCSEFPSNDRWDVLGRA